MENFRKRPFLLANLIFKYYDTINVILEIYEEPAPTYLVTFKHIRLTKSNEWVLETYFVFHKASINLHKIKKREFSRYYSMEGKKFTYLPSIECYGILLNTEILKQKPKNPYVERKVKKKDYGFRVNRQHFFTFDIDSFFNQH